jgi:hypothetical protein
MTQPRQSTPGNINPRVRSADDRPGDVSNQASHKSETSANEYSVAKLAVPTMTQPISCYATAATMATMATVLIHRFVVFLRMTGIVQDVSWAPASLVLKKAVSTP